MTTIYFATNRNPNRKKNPDHFGDQFHPDAIDNLRFGKADFARQKGKLELANIEVVPERLHEEATKSVLGSQTLFGELAKQMQKGVDTLTFIHGYNVSFEEALYAGAGIAETYTHPLNVVVFSWPSDGSMLPFLAYKSDRVDAAASGPALARALLKLRDFANQVARGQECPAKVHLMAHSMGNYVLRNGLQEALRHGTVPRLFEEIFLMAADEDDDAFEHEHKLRLLPRLGNRINLYFNRNDTALVISDRTKNNPTRLGSQGPREPLNVPANVTIVEASEVVGGVVEHSYFVEEARVVKDVDQVLGGSPHDQIRPRRYMPSQNRYVLAQE